MYTFEKYLLIALFWGTTLAINPLFSTDVFEFPKLLFLLLLVAGLTLVNIFKLERWKELKKAPVEFLLLGGILVANVVSFILSEDKSASLIGRDMRFQGFLTQVHYVFLALNVFIFFRGYPVEKTKSVFKWLIACLLVACAVAVSPYFMEVYIFHPLLFQNRVFGTFGNPNYLAAFIIALLPFYLLVLKPKMKSAIFLFLPGLILILFTLFLTGTRSAWIAAVAGFLFLGVLRVVKSKNWKTLVVTGIAIVIMVGTVIFQTRAPNPTETFERFSVETENLTSLKTRVYLWQSGLKLALERPLFGLGQDSIQNNIDPYLPEHLKNTGVFFIDRTHSELVDIAVMLGGFGLITYVGFFLAIFWKSIRKYFHTSLSKTDSYLEATLTAFFTLQLFHLVNFSTITTNVLIYFFAAYLVYRLTVRSDYQG